MSHSPVMKAETRLAFKRSGFAAILFAMVRPRDAKAAAVNEKTLVLTFAFRSIAVPLADIKTVMLGRGWSWRAVRIRHANGESIVSGLSQGDGQALIEALEAARVYWWRNAVYGRLAQLADPPSYTTHQILTDLRRDAEAVTGGFPSHWPDMLSNTSELLMLRDLRSFLNNPNRFRTEANQTCIANELKHSRESFDSIEARPLTGEQRTAVVTMEAARVTVWQKALAAQAGALRAVHGRLEQLAEPPNYTPHRILTDLRRDAEAVMDRFPSYWPDMLSNTSELLMLQSLRSFLHDPNRFGTEANQTYIANELKRSREFLDRVEARPLTDEQRRAVVVDEHRNLVVAAAGSGKTSVIVAKAGWLVHRDYRRPAELLLLAFAKDAQKEMEGRIRARLGAEEFRGITARTFHALGMSIIGEAEGKRPALARVAEDNRALLDLLNRIVAEQLADPVKSRILMKWFQDRFAPYKSKHEFRTWGEYWDYIRRYEVLSLKGEKVKSFEECEIANFLYLNGVPYKYERAYEHDTATSQKRQYQPDFYLPDAGIYIEHFALSATGETPAFINQAEYLRSMKWKRWRHAKHGTTLVETYSHEAAAGKLTENLGAKLEEHGVVLSPIPPDEIFAVLNERGRIDPFTQLVATFLQHYKGSGLTFRELERRAAVARDRPRAEAFVSVFKPIFERYQETLSGLGQIDFHDMINKAADHVMSGRYRSPYGYILVDEFQDISPARASLLKALLDQAPDAQLFAVGDDWQAIFRFAGSDIAIMREFEKRFGESERLNLETTFRCSNRIAEVATKFVLCNSAQIRKTVRATRKAPGPSVHVGLPGKKASLLREVLDEIAADADKQEGASTVLLLGRDRHTRPKNLSDLARRYPGLRFSSMTVHGSKGLEADYVVVLGVCSGRNGFPTEITDDPLLDLVLSAPERHPNAEERRLFYVALTRAKRRVFLVADGGPPSPFVKELIDDRYDVTVFGQLPESDAPCPKCVDGHLQQRENEQNKSTFYGCSNYPDCEYKRGIQEKRPVGKAAATASSLKRRTRR